MPGTNPYEGVSPPRLVTVKIQQLGFSTLEEALSRADRFVMICSKEDRRWYTLNRALPRVCPNCHGKLGLTVFPIAALIKRKPFSKAPNTVIVRYTRFQYYPIATMIRAYQHSKETIQDRANISAETAIMIDEKYLED